MNGSGGVIRHEAKFRFLPPFGDKTVSAWGLAKMDNGEIAVAGVAGNMPVDSYRKTVVAFSSDGGTYLE